MDGFSSSGNVATIQKTIRIIANYMGEYEDISKKHTKLTTYANVAIESVIQQSMNSRRQFVPASTGPTLPTHVAASRDPVNSTYVTNLPNLVNKTGYSEWAVQLANVLARIV